MDSVHPPHATYGAAFVGLVLSAILYGVTILQTYFYYRNYPDDSRWTKIIVFVAWFFDTLHLTLCTTAIYWYLIYNYNNPEALQKLTWSMELQTDCNALISLLVQGFYARRVWMMSSNVYLVTIIIALAGVHFGLGIVFTVRSFQLVDTSRFALLTWVTATGIGSAATADLMIAASLCYYLLKSKTGFKRTDSLIASLVIYTVTTGLMTSIIDVVIVVTFATMPTNYVWLAFFWIVGRCYVNSLLAALNSRDSLRERVKLRSPEHGDFLSLPQLSNMGSMPSDRAISSYHGPFSSLSVNVHKDVVTKTDYAAPHSMNRASQHQPSSTHDRRSSYSASSSSPTT